MPDFSSAQHHPRLSICFSFASRFLSILHQLRRSRFNPPILVGALCFSHAHGLTSELSAHSLHYPRVWHSLGLKPIRYDREVRKAGDPTL